jgi:hypothetical protein
MTAPAVALLIATLLNENATPAQRSDACYALRGNRSAEVVNALARSIGDRTVRACAARDLREAGAVDALMGALDAADPDTRAAAAHELGALHDAKAIEPLGRAALDENPLAAAAAIEALGSYQDPRVLPLLLRASGSGVSGVAALEQAARFHDPAVLGAVRRVLEQGDVAAQLIAISVLIDLGTGEDLPKLRDLASHAEPVAVRARGFGFMPVIDLGRAARNAIVAIEGRMWAANPGGSRRFLRRPSRAGFEKPAAARLPAYPHFMTRPMYSQTLGLLNAAILSCMSAGRLGRSAQTRLSPAATSGSPPVKPATSFFQRSPSAWALGEAGSSARQASTSRKSSVHSRLTSACISGVKSRARASILARASGE